MFLRLPCKSTVACPGAAPQRLCPILTRQGPSERRRGGGGVECIQVGGMINGDQMRGWPHQSLDFLAPTTSWRSRCRMPASAITGFAELGTGNTQSLLRAVDVQWPASCAICVWTQMFQSRENGRPSSLYWSRVHLRQRVRQACRSAATHAYIVACGQLHRVYPLTGDG